jgi:hypothetical protein
MIRFCLDRAVIDEYGGMMIRGAKPNNSKKNFWGKK